ncbi:hypothetical protein JK202_09260 [Gluconobacter sp. Dm-62]|uniref:hypothetical protein n=1 Tax=Gluconobacter sp. Dm-62 TaxID=2799804 RepID=UPI001B8A91E6|nr:hypothetical protein [Gluconobacter sp. Dm-62]MBS1103206.1 hypothetical protein [Gluconobacter sp. Dm-62]
MPKAATDHKINMSIQVEKEGSMSEAEIFSGEDYVRFARGGGAVFALKLAEYHCFSMEV